MPNRKRTIHSSPYIPNGGVNYDSDSLSVQPNQCTDILNYRIFPNRLQRRSGSRRISGVTPPSEAVLHYHNYRDADGSETLFGFTPTGIYKYTDGTQKWNLATRFEVLDNMETAATNWTTDIDSVVVDVAAGYDGGDAFFTLGLTSGRTISLGEILFAKGGAGAFDWDLSSYTHVGFWFTIKAVNSTIPTPYAFRLKFYSDDNFTVQVGGDCDASIAITPYQGVGEPTASFKQALIPLTTPSAMTSVKSFQIITNQASWSFDAGELPLFYIDYLTAVTLFSNSLSQYSTTEFTDNNKGATVVVAGSDPPNPVEADGDGPTRILMYYDRLKGYFRDVDQRSETRSVTSETLDTGDGATVEWPSLGTAQQIVDKDSLTITYITGGNTKTVTDDGEGNLTGDVDGTGTNTINYTTGSINFKATGAPDTSTAISATYDWYSALTFHPRLVYNFHNRIVLVNEYDGSSYHPWRVRWSDIANLEQYNEALNWTDRVDSDVSPYVGGAYMQKMLVLFRENSIELCRFIGGTSVFGFHTQWHDGTFAGRTAAKWQNVIFYLGKDDVYVFDGSTARRIGQFRLRNKIITDTLNHEKVHKCFGSVYPFHNEYWLWIIGLTDAGEPETYPSRAFVYRIDLDAWTVFDFEETPAMGLYHTKSGTTINDLIGTIDEQNWTLDGSVLEGVAEAPVLSRSSGDMYVLDERVTSDYGFSDIAGNWTAGSAIPTTLATKDFTYADLPRKERTTRLHYEAIGDTVDISYSKNFGKLWKNTQTKTLPLDFDRAIYWLDANAEHIRFKFETTTTAQFSVIRWMQALGITREKD